MIIAYLNGSSHHLVLSVIIQLSLAFGLAGLFWPDKFMPVFDVLMFPWAASYRNGSRTQHCGTLCVICSALFHTFVESLEQEKSKAFALSPCKARLIPPRNTLQTRKLL